MRSLFVLAVLIMSACNHRSAHNVHVAEANALTQYCAQSRLSDWNVRASAAGADCAVLLIATDIILEDSMVAAMHHGAGAYDLFDGGIEQYSRERAFRGVAYKDQSGRVWRYGKLHDGEVLRPCH